MIEIPRWLFWFIIGSSSWKIITFAAHVWEDDVRCRVAKMLNHQYELEQANDALHVARKALGQYDEPFLDDAIRGLLSRTEAQEALLRQAEDKIRRLEGRACLICGRDKPCELDTNAASDLNWPGSPCTFDPSPIEAAKHFWEECCALKVLLRQAEEALERADSLFIPVPDSIDEGWQEAAIAWGFDVRQTLQAVRDHLKEM